MVSMLCECPQLTSFNVSIYSKASYKFSSISYRLVIKNIYVELPTRVCPWRINLVSTSAKNLLCLSVARICVFPKDIYTTSCGALMCIDSGLILAVCICFAKREGRPLWERPEHATGQYLIHDISSIHIDNSTSKEKEHSVQTKTTTKRSGYITTYSCGCLPKNVFLTNFTQYSCGCPPDEVCHQTIGNQSPCVLRKCQQKPLPATNKASNDNIKAWKQVNILHS